MAYVPPYQPGPPTTAAGGNTLGGISMPLRRPVFGSGPDTGLYARGPTGLPISSGGIPQRTLPDPRGTLKPGESGNETNDWIPNQAGAGPQGPMPSWPWGTSPDGYLLDRNGNPIPDTGPGGMAGPPRGSGPIGQGGGGVPPWGGIVDGLRQLYAPGRGPFPSVQSPNFFQQYGPQLRALFPQLTQAGTNGLPPMSGSGYGAGIQRPSLPRF